MVSYLPDDCWEHVFKFFYDDDPNRRYLEPLSLVSKEFFSLTNRLRFSFTINSDQTRPYLRRIFQRFTNLTSLDFTLTRFPKEGNLNALLFEISRLPFNILNLKSFKFSNQYKIPSNGLRAFSKKITTLTSFTILNIDCLYYNDLVLISDCFPLLEEFTIISNRLSFDIIDVGVKAMSKALPKLSKINLSGYYHVNDSLLFHLCMNCEFLEEIVMLNCRSLTNDGIAYALRQRPTLSSLCVRWSNDNISSHFIDSLVSLKRLTCLHLSSSCISDELLFSIGKEGLALRRLLLQGCTGYSYAGIFDLLSKCRCMQHLDLQNAEFMTDHHVAELSLFLGGLVSINLTRCRMLTDSSLFALARECPSLNEIKMEDTSIGRYWVDYSNFMMNNVVNPQLKSLLLARNSWLRDKNIIMFASICPNLHFLDLSYCNGISVGIGEVLSCCKIRHLNLAWCSGLKLLRINIKVSTLEVLNLLCSKIDDRSLYAISKSCCGLLQLNLGRCNNVTEKGVMEVVKKCTKLREINLEYCCKVSANVVDLMVFIRPTLKKITAPPSFRFSGNKRRLLLHHRCLVCSAKF